MDGNLLDSENAEATLTKEWSFPELPPEKSSSLPTSSQDLADIFGTSNEGPNMEFPFNLSVETDLALAGPRDADYFMSSLNTLGIPASVTASSSSSSMVAEASGRREMSASEVVGARQGRVFSGQGGSGGGNAGMGGVSGLLDGSNCEGRDTKEETEEVDKKESSSSEADQDEPGPSSGMTLRKSTRILRKSVPALPPKTSVAKKASTPEHAYSKPPPLPESRASVDCVSESDGGRTGERPVETMQVQKDTALSTEGNIGSVEVKKEPVHRQTSAGGGGAAVKERGVALERGGVKKEETTEESDEGVDEEEDDDDDDGDGDESSDDPDRLWCICQQPHDDRFMICCDVCEEWYHGDCVGISVSQGKRMEREGKDYVCPVCVEKERQEKEERDLNRSARIGRREIVRENILKKKLGIASASPTSVSEMTTPTDDPGSGKSAVLSTKPSSVASSKPSTKHPPPPTPAAATPTAAAPAAAVSAPPTSSAARRRTSSTLSHGDSAEDQYGLAQLFQPDNAPKAPTLPTPSADLGAVKEEPGVVKTEGNTFRTKFKEEYTGTCLVADCKKPTMPPSVYCSDQCLELHVAQSLQKLEERGVALQTNPQEFVRGSGGVSVLEMATGKMLVGIAAPSAKNLVPWLKKHPSYQVLLHRKGKGEKKKLKVKTESKKETKKESEEASKIPKISLMDPASVRANAKRALFQILWKRCEDAADMTSLEQNKVEEIANDIEIKLFNLHGDINPKYKNKYRSLVFNLKDTKNQGLFRKVVLADISAHDLVRMSTEKLASDELAQWREKTIKKNLEMIKEREEEAGALGKVIRKFTYKGEVEIDTADDIKIEGSESPANAEGDEHLAASAGDGPSRSHTYPIAKPRSKPLADSSKSTTSGGGGGKGMASGGGAGGILHLLESSKESVTKSESTDTTSQHGHHVYDQNCDICTKRDAPPPATPPPSPPPPPPPAEAMEEEEGAPEETPYSPSSQAGEELMETESDAVGSPSTMVSMHQVVWKGFVNMSGLTKFATTAYPVAGPVDELDMVLPDTLHVMGRIAHVQVWDYMDKLRSSTSRDIVVLRFVCIGDEESSYMSMLTYLLKKHRCGVINCCFPEVKDMYLVPLQAGGSVPPQLLPFQGPGLPPGHGDLLLGLIVRSRRHRTEVISPQHGEKVMAEVCLKRHYSASYEPSETPSRPAKRSKMAVEVGVNGETPPRLSGFQDDIGEDDDDYNNSQDAAHAAPVENSHSTPPLTSGSGREAAASSRHRTISGGDNSSSSLTPIAAPTTFFGSHQPLPLEQRKSDGGTRNADRNSVTTIGSSVTSSTKGTLDSIFSQLSDEKLFNDLASAVSKVTKKPFGAHSTGFSGSGTASSSSRPDYGANTPPPEDLEPGPSHISASERLPRVAGGPPFPQQQGGISMTASNTRPLSVGSPSKHVDSTHPNQAGAGGQSGSQEWERDRERFANTPPPEYQMSFNFPQQGAGGIGTVAAAGSQYQGNNNSAYQLQQQQQQQQQHLSSDPRTSTSDPRTAGDPRTAYGRYPPSQDLRGQPQQQQQQQQQQQRGGWDYDRHYGSGNRHQGDKNGSYAHKDGGFPRGDRLRDRGGGFRHDNYGHRRGRGFRHDRRFSQGVKEEKYPAEWYRK